VKRETNISSFVAKKDMVKMKKQNKRKAFEAS
jgi:hypothetical protein